MHLYVLVANACVPIAFPKDGLRVSLLFEEVVSVAGTVLNQCGLVPRAIVDDYLCESWIA